MNFIKCTDIRTNAYDRYFESLFSCIMTYMNSGSSIFHDDLILLKFRYRKGVFEILNIRDFDCILVYSSKSYLNDFYYRNIL